jgi:glycyl-tRNA synthetase beta chain
MKRVAPMADGKVFLVEIGTEELPPQALTQLATALRDEIRSGLIEAELVDAEVDAKWFCSPRRMAVMVSGVRSVQADREEHRRGPSMQAAYGPDGKPTKAAQGFAKSCGVSVADLDTESTDKGIYLVVRRTLPGSPAKELLPDIVASAVTALPTPKRMRWGDSEIEFVRPVHWVLMRLGRDVVDGKILGLQTTGVSRGHRFHHPEQVRLRQASSYPTAMVKAKVLLEDEAGHLRQRIADLVIEAGKKIGGEVTADPDDALVREVAGLVEWPVPVVGRFVEAFLTLPEEVLISVLAKHQRCFTVRDSDGQLMPYFVAVANIESKDADRVRHGNERVVHPRLSDAMFFYSQDQKSKLASRCDALSDILFQKDLGTLADKSARVSALAAYIAPRADADPDRARRAAQLSKCDLMTEMVGEFPELQGVMGRYYALADGEDPDVAAALEDQYRPRFSGDSLPESDTGAVLAVADKLDTIVGIFAVGQAPTGVRDPFGVRRATLGVLRICVESQLDLDLQDLVHEAVRIVDPAKVAGDTSELEEQIYSYFMDRLRGYFIDRGNRGDVFDAVAADRGDGFDALISRPLDIERRITAVEAFLQMPAAADLTAANKRIANILKKSADEGRDGVDKSLLKEDAEIALNGVIERLEHTIVPNLQKGRYGIGLEGLADLRGPVDRFFDDILVMASDSKLRTNRIALLRRLRELFLHTADLSLIQAQDEASDQAKGD